jgi:uncharacterized membrane protein HdeD (DUF308 family)
MSTDSFDEELRALPQSVYEQRVSCSIAGVLLVVMGSLVIVTLSLVTVAVTSFLGWLFLVRGIVGLVTTFWARLVPGFCWSLLSAMLVISAGIILLEWAVPGAISLTLLLIVFFVIEGGLSIMYALEHKRALSGPCGWMLVSGIIGFILAAVIWAGLPGTVEWVLGLLVGINMLCGGSAMIAMAKCGSSLDHNKEVPKVALLKG